MEFNKKIVFVVGAPRSGTTWLQIALYQHPKVVTSQETHLFSRYISKLDKQWQEYLGKSNRPDMGLSGLLTQVEFDDILRRMAIIVLNRIVEKKPMADVVVEKTPDHVNEWQLIHRLFPQAYFLHIIRDPRSVVCSLQKACSDWGMGWASTSIIENSEKWCSDIQNGRAIQSQILGSVGNSGHQSSYAAFSSLKYFCS